MKIIILGAGQVGRSLASSLAGEANDITVVDQDDIVLRDLQDRYDLVTVTGQGSHPEVLERAGANDADMVIAVTDSDEVNMVACQVAYTLFHTPTKIARIRSVEYLEHQKLFSQECLPVDVLISPEQIVTDHITRLIEHPGALQVLDFAGGRARMVAMRAYYGGPLVGHELSTLREHIPGVECRVAALFRRGKAILPKGNTVIEAGDEVFFVAAKDDIRDVMSEFSQSEKKLKRIVIAGGGNIGVRLAKALESSYQIKVIEQDPIRARQISNELNKAIVLLGDAADEDLLIEENIEKTDMFCALTNDDEANVLSGMLAKRLGARKVMSIINRPAYVDMVQGSVIDIAVSPQQATIGSLLTHIRLGDVVMVHSLRRGAAEAMEAIAHGDKSSSKVVGRAVEDIKLPPDTSIGAIVRGDEVIVAHHDVVIEPDDHVILFLVDKKRASEIEKLFQVGVTFF